MNANLQTLSAPASSVEPLPPADPSQPRSKSKIAHLPKDKRDLINHLMDDGVTYEGIIARLAELGITLNLKNVSDWFHGGYQDELLARERRAQLRLHQEHLLACAAEDINSLPLAGLQLAVTQLSQQIYQLAPGAHKESFQNDTTQYLRMLNTLARMSKAMLSLQQYQDQTAQPESTQLQQIDA